MALNAIEFYCIIIEVLLTNLGLHMLTSSSKYRCISFVHAKFLFLKVKFIFSALLFKIGNFFSF